MKLLGDTHGVQQLYQIDRLLHFRIFDLNAC